MRSALTTSQSRHAASNSSSHPLHAAASWSQPARRRASRYCGAKAQIRACASMASPANFLRGPRSIAAGSWLAATIRRQSSSSCCGLSTSRPSRALFSHASQTNACQWVTLGAIPCRSAFTLPRTVIRPQQRARGAFARGHHQPARAQPRVQFRGRNCPHASVIRSSRAALHPQFPRRARLYTEV